MGLKRAVLVGCLYRKPPHELQGCINDVSRMKSLLKSRFHFQEENIQVLTDDTNTPTRENIMNALKQMIVNAECNDVLFFFFSGYGTSYGNQPAIVPLDAIGPIDESNLITRDDLQTLVKDVPPGATLTIVADSGHSGRLIDVEPAQIETLSSNIEARKVAESKWKSKSISLSSFNSPSTVPSPTMGANRTKCYGIILLSACQPDETAFEAVPASNPAEAYGAFTRAIGDALGRPGGPIGNKELFTDASRLLQGFGVNQLPALYCSDRIFLS